MNLTYILNELMKTLSKATGSADVTIIMKKQPFERLVVREWYENHRVFVPKETLANISSLQVNTSSGSVVIQRENP